ncbi:hypothetical protein [Pelistega ratti]|uniref:hypothetical protein n=1 Tax=Pelistega ratti TaxID=2652177 RepID=UPI00135C4C79|nr:hypothetical protein [Pelistega ratti]
MNKADFLSQHKPKVEKIEVDGKTIYLRELTVGDNNFIMFETQAYMLQRAKQLGIEIDMSNGTQIEAQLKQVEDPYMLARQAAMRICDEEGNLLFDFRNVDDLDQLNSLGQSFLTIFQDTKKKS